MVPGRCLPGTLCGISSRFQLLSPSERQVAHTLLTRPPLSHGFLRRISFHHASFDLHVLGTPPAFILSQDQTLNKSYLKASCKALKSDLLIRFPALKRNCLENISVLLKNPFLGAYFCISCSYIVQFSRYISASPFRGQLD